MKFILTPQAWILADLDPIEWSFLDRLPRLASGEDFSKDCRRRLSPDPLDVPASRRADYEEFLEDWEEYVRPDIGAAYGRSRDQVSRDLDLARARLAEQLRDTDAPGDVRGHPALVAIARESADDWYSTLNQARLLLNEAHDLAESSDRFHREMPKRDGKPDAAKIMLLAQYEFYTALQSIMLETVMRGDSGDGDDEEEE